MSISSIGNNPAISNIQFSGIAPVASQGSDSDGDNDGSGVAKASGAGGRFASAINQALAQLGVTPGSSSTATGSSSASLQQSFQNLLAADGANGSNVSPTGFLQALRKTYRARRLPGMW